MLSEMGVHHPGVPFVGQCPCSCLGCAGEIFFPILVISTLYDGCNDNFLFICLLLFAMNLFWGKEKKKSAGTSVGNVQEHSFDSSVTLLLSVEQHGDIKERSLGYLQEAVACEVSYQVGVSPWGRFLSQIWRP